MLRWPYLWRPPLDRFEFLIYCSSHTPLLPNQRDLKAHYSFAIIIENFLENKRKYTCRAALVADRFLSFSPLDHVYFMICGAPICCLLDGGDRKHTLRQGVVRVE
jgi:hypothetical protein